MREKILKYFELTRSMEASMIFVDIMCDAMAAEMGNDDLADRAVNAIRSTVKAELPSLTDKFVELYARTYNEEEIDAMIAYHSSPVGQKIAAVSKQLSFDGAALGNTLQPKIMAALTKVLGE